MSRPAEEIASGTRRLRILIVEDEAAHAEAIRRAFEIGGAQAEVQVAGTLREYRERVVAGAPDIALVDLNLPDGRAVEILTAPPEVGAFPILIMTSYGNEQIVVEALKSGALDYVVKSAGAFAAMPRVVARALREWNLLREHQQAERALRQSEARFRTVARLSSDFAYSCARIGAGDCIVDWITDAFYTLTGFSEAQLREHKNWLFVVHPEDRQIALEPLRRLRPGETSESEFRIVAREGGIRWFVNRMECEAEPGTVGGLRFYGAVRDMTEHRRGEERLRLLATAFESTRDGVVITDPKARILAVNRAYSDITGYDEAEILGQNPRILQSGRHDRAFYQTLWTSVRNAGYWQGELWNRRKNGEIYPQWLTISAVRDGRGEATHYVGVLTDISQIKSAEERLDRLAHRDPLTDLPNRLLAQSRLTHALEQAQRHGRRVGVLFVDLDRFKTVNESLGHSAGDELLRAIARRLRAGLGAENTLARLGGDEFLVVVEDPQRPEEVAAVAQTIFDLLADPVVLSSHPEIYINASIGLSLYPDDGRTVTELIQHADAAVSQAKAQGRNTYRFYTEALTRAAHERLELENKLRRALERDELVLHYQPLVSVASGRIVGCEALVRWRPPGEALVPPARFIPLAEETGLIEPLGNWVLRTACAQAKAWLDAGLPLLLAVNLSARQFQRQDIPQQVRTALADTGLPAQHLELEITESTLMEQGGQALDVLMALKRLGVRLAIDDFGTGYSSLAYLKRFPIDKLKIDQSFVRDIPNDSGDMEIAAAIIAMARSLRLAVLAEGVETREQLDFLRGQGCDAYQGFLFGHPVPGDAFATLLATSSAPARGGPPRPP